MRYPIGVVFDETELVVERVNGLEATRAVLTQMAVSALFSKEAGKAFQEKIKQLSGVQEDEIPAKTGKDLLIRTQRDGEQERR